MIRGRGWDDPNREASVCDSRKLLWPSTHRLYECNSRSFLMACICSSRVLAGPGARLQVWALIPGVRTASQVALAGCRRTASRSSGLPGVLRGGYLTGAIHTQSTCVFSNGRCGGSQFLLKKKKMFSSSFLKLEKYLGYLGSRSPVIRAQDARLSPSQRNLMKGRLQLI